MASIRKLANGNYQATVYCGRDSNGKQLRKYITKEKEKDVKREARELEADIEAGRFAIYDNVYFEKWMDQWLELVKNKISPSTYMSYKLYINTHFKPSLGKLKISQINEIHIKKYLNEKLKTLKGCTVKKHFFVLRKILYEVLKDKSPMKDIEPPKKGEYKPHAVTEDEFVKISNAFKGSVFEIAILLAGYCGMRRGEIYALKWDDINFDKGTIRIDESRVLSEDGYIDKDPKSNNGLREIVAPSFIFDALKRIKKTKMNSVRIMTGRPNNLTNRFKKVMDKLKLNIRFHDLRHYHASWLYKKNVPDHYAASRLGHDIQTLKKIYQHIDVESTIEIDNNIINLMKKV